MTPRERNIKKLYHRHQFLAEYYLWKAMRGVPTI